MEYMEVCFNANFKDTMDKRRVYTRGNKKMMDIIKRTSKLNAINREDTLKIWNLTY